VKQHLEPGIVHENRAEHEWGETMTELQWLAADATAE
jgi:hypothetical protein